MPVPQTPGKTATRTARRHSTKISVKQVRPSERSMFTGLRSPRLLTSFLHFTRLPLPSHFPGDIQTIYLLTSHKT
ncbi:hypothetical protein E2C01_008008 [Portunus trituberculatus]|uniref:Uncharacterized protein n=1 Tax=Portunus trituberculatus TaxID=210409 RepID=A0A5B7D525_PORTR|nr:hypothetical protein [Portunus trituberculatus]